MTRIKKTITLLLLLAPGIIFYKLFFSKTEAFKGNFENKEKNLMLYIDGADYRLSGVEEDTVSDLMRSRNIDHKDFDYVFPPLDSKIYDNSKIIIKREKEISISVGGKKVEGKTLGSNVASALWDNNIELGDDDFTNPSLETPIINKSKIEVVRVEIKEEIVKKDVDFEKKSTEDDKLSWRTKKISQKGEKGIDEYRYKVVSHNGKEISRKLLSKERTKDPVSEIAVQGTYMKLGKVNNGLGTWYAFKGGLFAASPWLPMGSYAKVTNKENGKSVVVQINDRGPFGPNRIIDLDKVAFEKIAGLGAGVIDTKVEQVLN